MSSIKTHDAFNPLLIIFFSVMVISQLMKKVSSISEDENTTVIPLLDSYEKQSRVRWRIEKKQELVFTAHYTKRA